MKTSTDQRKQYGWQSATFNGLNNELMLAELALMYMCNCLITKTSLATFTFAH